MGEGAILLGAFVDPDLIVTVEVRMVNGANKIAQETRC